jgi:hypothetical protein
MTEDPLETVRQILAAEEERVNENLQGHENNVKLFARLCAVPFDAAYGASVLMQRTIKESCEAVDVDMDLVVASMSRERYIALFGMTLGAYLAGAVIEFKLDADAVARYKEAAMQKEETPE